MRSRYKGRSSATSPRVEFRTFGDVRPLMNKYALPVYGDPDALPFEIVCDAPEVALALKERLREADRLEFEHHQCEAFILS